MISIYQIPSDGYFEKFNQFCFCIKTLDTVSRVCFHEVRRDDFGRHNINSRLWGTHLYPKVLEVA